MNAKYCPYCGIATEFDERHDPIDGDAIEEPAVKPSVQESEEIRRQKACEAHAAWKISPLDGPEIGRMRDILKWEIFHCRDAPNVESAKIHLQRALKELEQALAEAPRQKLF